MFCDDDHITETLEPKSLIDRIGNRFATHGFLSSPLALKFVCKMRRVTSCQAIISGTRKAGILSQLALGQKLGCSRVNLGPIRKLG